MKFTHLLQVGLGIHASADHVGLNQKMKHEPFKIGFWPGEARLLLMGSGTGSSEIKGNSHALHPQYVFGPTIGLPLQEAPQQQIRAHDRNANC